MAPLAEPAAELVVWIANPVGATDQPYVKAVMIATDDESAAASDLGARCVVRPVGGGPEVQLRTSEVHPCNPSGHRPDNTQLLYLNEPCVIENIAHRYEELVLAAAYSSPAPPPPPRSLSSHPFAVPTTEQEIYTWTSRILVAVNPYETVRCTPLRPHPLLPLHPGAPIPPLFTLPLPLFDPQWPKSVG